MKNSKFILSLVAFVFAIIGAFTSQATSSKKLSGIDWYITTGGVCTQVPDKSCNNEGIFTCRFNPAGSQGYADVHESIDASSACITVITHSLDNGLLN